MNLHTGRGFRIATASIVLVAAGVVLGHRWGVRAFSPEVPGLPDMSPTRSAQVSTVEVEDLGMSMADPGSTPPADPDTPGPWIPAPLPPLSMPLSEVRDELLRRAAAGEPQAACRLALSLSGCARLNEHRRTAVRDEADLVDRLARTGPEFRAGIENQIKFFLARQQNAQQWVAYCEATKVDRQDVVAALRRATELGNLAATERYLQFMTMLSAPYLLAHPAEAGVHRDTLRQAVARMVRERDPGLLPWIGMLTDQHMGPLFTDLLPEPFLDSEIGILAYRLASRTDDHLEVQFPRGETPSAETLARAEAAYREHFTGGPDHAERLARMQRSRSPGYIDQDVFDRLEGCVTD